MTLSERQRKPAFPAPIPNRSDTEKTEDGASRGQLCETAGLGAFSRQIQAKTKRARRIARQAPFLSHPHRPDGTPPPAHLCRSAGLRPAGQTVLRTVLGGRPAAAPTAAPGAAGPAGLPSALPCRPPAPPRQRARRTTRQAPFLLHPYRPNGTAARSASTNCASAGLAVSCRQTAMTSSFSSAPVSGMNTRFSAGEYLRAE